MKKRLITGFLLALLLLPAKSTYAQEDIRIRKIVDDEIIKTIEENEYRRLFSKDQLGVYTKAGTEMIPVRVVAEELGFSVNWNNKLRQVDIQKDNLITSLKAGENYYFFARMAPIKLSHAPENKDGVMYVPMEFFKEVLKEELIIVGNDLAVIKTKVEEIKKEDMEITGYVKDIHIDENTENVSILLGVDSSELNLEEIILHLVDETKIEYKDRDDEMKSIKVGDKIEALTPRYMTMSLPPQTTSKYLKVSSFMELENGIRQGLNYPVIKNMNNPVIKSKFNQMIEEFIFDLESKEIFDNMNLSYKISALNQDRISLIFTGKFKHLNKETELIKSLNMDLKTGKILDYDNYFKNDRISRDKLKGLLRLKVRENYGREFEAEGINMYFTENHLVIYYYELDDDVSYPIEIYLSFEDIKDLISE